jgi:hypothetical protein
MSNRESSSAINAAVARKIWTAMYCSPWIYIIFIVFFIYFIFSYICICGLLYDAISIDAKPTASNDGVIVNGAVVDYTELLSQHFTWASWNAGRVMRLGFQVRASRIWSRTTTTRPRNSVTYLYTVKIFTCFGLQSVDSVSCLIRGKPWMLCLTMCLPIRQRTSFNLKNLCIFSTQCIYAFCTILTIIIDYFPQQNV